MILGMHRSGTSAVTRLVNLVGPSVCVRGDLLMGTSSNVKGFWESTSLIKLNDELLADSDHSWWYPPSIDDLRRWEPGVDRATVNGARAVFDRAHPSEPWVWKDPRTCLTLSFWRRTLAQRVAGVVVYRNPLDVARSLERRNLMSVEFGLALWMRYTRALIEQAGGMPLMVSNYDDILEDPEAWSAIARGFLGDLGMAVDATVDAASIREFVNPKLRHNAHSPPDRGATADLFDALRSFGVPSFDDEAPWIGEQFAAVGPEWHSTWKDPSSSPPTIGQRLRVLMKRASFVGR